MFYKPVGRIVFSSFLIMGTSVAQATPFLPLDARGIAMGNTGVASAKRAHAPAYNPALLTHKEDTDNFALLLPQVGVNLADEGDLGSDGMTIIDDVAPEVERQLSDDISEGDTFTAAINQLKIDSEILREAFRSAQTAENQGQAEDADRQIEEANEDFKSSLSRADNQRSEFEKTTAELSNLLTNVSEDPLRARLSLGLASTLNTQQVDAALFLRSTADISSRAVFSPRDNNFISGLNNANLAYFNVLGDVSNKVDIAVEDTRDENARNDAIAEIDRLNNFEFGVDDTAAGDIFIFKNGRITEDAEDAKLDSTIEVIGVNINEIGISLSRELTIANKNIAIGITPKAQLVETFHYVTTADSDEDIDFDEVQDNSESDSHFNLDIGAAMYLDSQQRWRLGAVVKNIVAAEFAVPDANIEGSDLEIPKTADSVEVEPQIRVGASYTNSWFSLAVDYDVTENAAIAFESPTQYAAIGTEFDLFDTAQLRFGYRTNLAATNGDTVSVGFGLSPFGLHLDIAAVANPNDIKKEAGVVVETGFYF